ncbi:MAG: transcriptional repressor [Alphaproteobacteria bacterium]|nr:transcriptional repressor [Alphaproteobacteria bacterium]
MSQNQHNHETCKADLIDRAEKLCSSRGTKLTNQRRIVLQRIAESHNAVGAYEIIERMASMGARPAPITIYRALDFLLDHDLVHRVESRNAYIACTCNHATSQPILLVCAECGLVNEVYAPSAALAVQATTTALRFTAKKIVLEVTGICADCVA